MYCIARRDERNLEIIQIIVTLCYPRFLALIIALSELGSGTFGSRDYLTGGTPNAHTVVISCDVIEPS